MWIQHILIGLYMGSFKTRWVKQNYFLVQATSTDHCNNWLSISLLHLFQVFSLLFAARVRSWKPESPLVPGWFCTKKFSAGQIQQFQNSDYFLRNPSVKNSRIFLWSFGLLLNHRKCWPFKRISINFWWFKDLSSIFIIKKNQQILEFG